MGNHYMKKPYLLLHHTYGTDGTNSYGNVPITNNIDYAFIVGAYVQYPTSPYTVWTMPYYNDSMRVIKSFTTIGSGNQKQLTCVSNGTAFNNCSCVAVVRYTKTTD